MLISVFIYNCSDIVIQLIVLPIKIYIKYIDENIFVPKGKAIKNSAFVYLLAVKLIKLAN